MFGPETTLKYISFIIMFHAKLALLCAVLWETKVIITKVSWRIIKSSSTMFILQIHCHAPWYLPLVLYWWFESIRDVLVNFVSVWMKRRSLSVKRPLCLCIWGAARGSKPVFVWIKMKGFRSRLFLLQTCQKSDLRYRGAGWGESRVEGKNWRFEKLRLSDFCIKKVKLSSRCMCVSSPHSLSLVSQVLSSNKINLQNYSMRD